MAPTEATRIEEIQKKVATATETYSVRFQNERKLLSVITISLDNVLLNPRSHRIRAQIESHDERALLEAAPLSDRAQEIIENILAETPGFELLKHDIEDKGQLEPGIITHAGVLVNANTRAVALRQLRKQYIRVAVLPSSANENEITELEARLQLSRDLKQEYSLTNELLFIQEQLEAGMSKEDLALLLGKAQSRSNKKALKAGVEDIESSLRILQHIREIQALGGGQPPLTFFDAHESALTEADSAYMAAAQRSMEEARRVRDGRMLGILTRVTYRNLRNWDSDQFLEEYVIPRFTPEDIGIDLAELVGKKDSEPGSDDGWGFADEFSNTEEADSPLEISDLLGVIVRNHDQPAESELRDGLTKAELVEKIRVSITDAANEKASDERDEKLAIAPFKLIREARKKVEKATTSFEAARQERDFEPGKFRQELRRMKKELDTLIAMSEGRG